MRIATLKLILRLLAYINGEQMLTIKEDTQLSKPYVYILHLHDCTASYLGKFIIFVLIDGTYNGMFVI